MNPYAIKMRDGSVVDHLDWQNAAEQVRYGATWVSYDAALCAIAAERAGQRKPATIDAKVDA
ncbi:hypothetical protein FJ872_25780 [Mesorhizobium sp. B2-5-9]|uniref:hypothetical protein n=1 Tax=Mesorhizobium sp. B2-5-9 TaxID=2589921 RepID=UPI00112A9121|nr:hypothetical protein [Mesorhizobium sp. B2-5-9]TPK05699.1 hypothetical protein FJ872_25780 [Mesorhizobium sp. B2-5-9]